MQRRSKYAKSNSLTELWIYQLQGEGRSWNTCSTSRAKVQGTIRAKGADQRTATPKSKSEMALESGFLPVLAGRAGFFPWLGFLVLFPGPCVFPVCFFFFFLFLSFGRGRHVPAPGWEGRRVKREGTDPRNGTRTGFSRYSSTYDFLVYLVAPVLYFVFHFVILFSAYAFSDNANSVLSGARQVLQSPQDLFDPLEKYRLLWMEEGPLDCLLRAPRELSNRVTSYSWDAIRWYCSKRM